MLLVAEYFYYYAIIRSNGQLCWSGPLRAVVRPITGYREPARSARTCCLRFSLRCSKPLPATRRSQPPKRRRRLPQALKRRRAPNAAAFAGPTRRAPAGVCLNGAAVTSRSPFATILQRRMRNRRRRPTQRALRAPRLKPVTHKPVAPQSPLRQRRRRSDVIITIRKGPPERRPFLYLR